MKKLSHFFHLFFIVSLSETSLFMFSLYKTLLHPFCTHPSHDLLFCSSGSFNLTLIIIHFTLTRVKHYTLVYFSLYFLYSFSFIIFRLFFQGHLLVFNESLKQRLGKIYFFIKESLLT